MFYWVFINNSFHYFPLTLIFLQRNYRFFFTFISTSTILCIYVFAFSWIHIIRGDKGTWGSIKSDYLSDILIIYCFVAVWFVGGLTAFHLYLICTNQVTLQINMYYISLISVLLLVIFIAHNVYTNK